MRTWTGACFGAHRIDHVVATRETAWVLANQMWAQGRTVQVKEQQS